jgi:endonuclease/exonuclease/phosphatase family metal-dependent hydrolase
VQPRTASTTIGAVRLATFNILHGRSLTDGLVDLDRFASAVAALDADVLALQEVDRDQPRSHGADLTDVAAQAMGAPEHRFVATLAGTPDLWTAATGELQPNTAGYGIALLSRHPVLTWRVLALPGLKRRVPVLFPGNRRPVLVDDEPRAALAAVVDAPGGPLTVVSTHLSFIPMWNATQLRRLVRSVRSMPRPTVVMGDLNLERGRPGLVTGWRSLTTAATYPVARPTRQLDHILADGDVRAAGPGEAMDLGLSDHRALAVDVVLHGHA